MHLKIENKGKLEIFVALFQLLKNWSGHISMIFEKDRFYIQAMDKSHVCLANIDIKSHWFTEYVCGSTTKVTVDASHFCILMNYSVKHDIVEFRFDDDDSKQDKLFITCLNEKDKINADANEKTKSKEKDKKSTFNHYFELSLIDVEEDTLHIPKVDYDVEYNIDSKRLVEVLDELNNFGSDLHITCNENSIELFASGEASKLTVAIPTNELNEYAIAEGEEFHLSFSLNHICKMCATNKLSETIDVLLSSEFPMVFKYNLGADSFAVFYVAPKISE
jgi:proliferating cell nuclear antigen PCNA